MKWTARTAPLSLAALLACGQPVDTSATDATSSGPTTTTTGSTGTATSTSTATTQATTGGSASGTQGATTTTTGATTTTTSTSTGATTSTATTEASTGTSASSSTTGMACSEQDGPCNQGELCCPGLNCCAGVPVPPGEEFCSDNCPISDRNAKAEFRPIDVADILARVVALDITTWRYKKDGPDVRHLGPMAQDFRAAFGLSNNDRMIFPLDAAGVSLAAIQGLHRRLVAAEAENEALRDRLDRLDRRLGELEGR